MLPFRDWHGLVQDPWAGLSRVGPNASRSAGQASRSLWHFIHATCCLTHRTKKPTRLPVIESAQGGQLMATCQAQQGPISAQENNPRGRFSPPDLWTAGCTCLGPVRAPAKLTWPSFRGEQPAPAERLPCLAPVKHQGTNNSTTGAFMLILSHTLMEDQP